MSSGCNDRSTVKPGSQYDADAQLSVKLQRNRRDVGGIFDVDADVDAGIGFISIVDVDVDVNIVNWASDMLALKANSTPTPRITSRTLTLPP